MPEYRSVSVWIMSHWDTKLYPEFSHPESTQFQLKSPSLTCADGSNPDGSNVHLLTPSKADKILGRSPSVSVYIPSLSGQRFSVKYSIAPPHPSGQSFYFKMFMNGRHITSWAVNPRTKPVGYVERALFQPDKADGKWDFRDKKRRHKGPELRSFHFTERKDGKEAKTAEDGGLIEVKVFRMSGKKKRDPYLELCRFQDQYGIALPSSGRLERPSEAKYYDVLLTDPLDEPFATFRFHYRSWESLEFLQIVPAGHPRNLVSAKKSSTVFALQPSVIASATTKSNVDDSADDYDGDTSSLLNSSPSSRLHTGLTSATRRTKPTVFDQIVDVNIKPEQTQSYVNDSVASPEQPKRRLRLPISRFSVQRNTEQWWEPPAPARPLPEVPAAPESPPRTGLTEHSRKSSASSLTPSIAPSLLPYIDEESDAESSPEPFIGTAAMVTLPQLVARKVEMSSEDRSVSTMDDEHPNEFSGAVSALNLTLHTFNFDFPPEAVFPPPTPVVMETDNTLLESKASHIDDDDSFQIDSSSLEDPFVTTGLSTPSTIGQAISPMPTEGEWLRRRNSSSPFKQRLELLQNQAKEATDAEI